MLFLFVRSKKIEDETRKAKANATSNKRVAAAALRQKHMYEQELDRLAGRRITLETQVRTSFSFGGAEEGFG